MTRDLLELLYFLSAPALAIIAGFGLRSLGQAKKESKLRTTREAIVIAAEQCRYFASRIVELTNEYEKELIAKGAQARWKLKDNEFLWKSLENPNGAAVWLTLPAVKESLEKALHILNELESFAIYFTSGAGDESIAYGPVAPPFCSEIALLAPLLIAMREKNGPMGSAGRFPNIVKLYATWNQRRTEESVTASAVAAGMTVTGSSSPKITPVGLP